MRISVSSPSQSNTTPDAAFGAGFTAAFNQIGCGCTGLQAPGVRPTRSPAGLFDPEHDLGGLDQHRRCDSGRETEFVECLRCQRDLVVGVRRVAV